MLYLLHTPPSNSSFLDPQLGCLLWLSPPPRPHPRNINIHVPRHRAPTCSPNLCSVYSLLLYGLPFLKSESSKPVWPSKSSPNATLPRSFSWSPTKQDRIWWHTSLYMYFHLQHWITLHYNYPEYIFPLLLNIVLCISECIEFFHMRHIQ